MQPYFFPYIGYFQLIGSVDMFIVYDNIKYTKKGWINRNRLLMNGKETVFSIPLKGDSDFLDIRDRELSPDFNRDKLLNKIKGAYQGAPHFKDALALIERIIMFDDPNLFRYLHNSIVMACQYLGAKAEIAISSDIRIDHSLKGQDKVISICEAVGADVYINAIGGTGLYDREDFRARGVELKFIRPRPFEYGQLGDEFVPWLSIIDIMMFNSVDTISNILLNNYDLV